MKKHFIPCIIILCTLFIFSCKDNDSFIISGTVNNPGSLKKVFLIEQGLSGISVVDSTNLSEEGKFQFQRNAPYINLYALRIGGAIFDLIAKKGETIDFSTSLGDTTHAYQISGSDESQKIKEFNRINNIYVGKKGKLYEEYSEKAQAIGKESDSLNRIYLPLFQKVNDESSLAALKFVSGHKNSLAGFYAAVTSLDSVKYEQQLVAYADYIKDKFKDNPTVQRFVKQMMVIKPISIGHKAPDFTTAGIDGNPVKLSDFKGKYVMLDFWASWCAPCRAENPNVVKQYKIYKPLGLNILGISLDQDRGKWQEAVKVDGLVWQHGSDLKNFEGATERLYHVEAIPSNFIIDPQGIIIAKNITGTDLEEFLNKTFSKSQQIVNIK